MANTSAPPELDKQKGTQDMLVLNNDLERMIEDIENLSVQLTWMTYDVVRLRISPELAESMQKVKDAHDRCKVAVYGEQDQEQDLENMEKSSDPAPSPDCIDLENILKGIDAMSKCMEQLAMRTQLKQCDLIICVGDPVKLASLNIHEAPKQQPRA